MSRKFHGVLSVAVAGVLAAAGAQAEETKATVLEEIVVTAQKRVEKLQDVPLAVTVVNETQLENQHVYNITDLARTTPALEMVQAFGGPGGGGQIRGIGTTSFTRSAEGAVGIVVDGVPQGNVNTSNIFDVQRIEVLRGPQGTLFGLTSSAGVINMITVAPDPTKFETKVHLDYSNEGTAGSGFGEQTLRGVVNIPIGDTSALRLSATGDKTTGVQRDERLHEDNESNDFGVRARYRLKSSDTFEMNLIVDYDKRTQNFSDPQFTYISANTALTARLAACGITPGYDNFSRCPVNKTDDNVKSYGGSAQFDIGVGSNTLTSITAYRRNTSGPSNIDIMGLPPDPFSDGTQIFGTDATASAHQFSQELRISSPSAQKVEYVAGLFYSDYLGNTGVLPGGAFNVQVTIPIPPPPFTFGLLRISHNGQFTETSNKSTAAFGQMTYHVTEQLGLIGGLRYTHQKITDQASANIYPLLPPPASQAPSVPTFGELSEDNVSGKLGVQFKFSPNLTSYFTATRGYKGPQVAPAAQGTPATVIEAEIPLAFELGVKGAMLDGKLGVDANIFHTDVKNYQGQRCALNAVGVLVCRPETVPSVVTKGVELDLYGQPLTGLTLNGGIIYDIAQYPNGWTGYNPDDLRSPTPGVPATALYGTTSLSDAQIVGVPKTKFSLAADYHFPMGAVEGFLSADTVYKSDMRMGPSGDPRFIYPAHWNSGARFGVRSASGSWSVAVFGRNLGNDHEPVTIFGGPSFTPPAPGPGSNPAQPNGYVNGISGWGTANSLRQVGLSVDAKF